MQAVRHEELRTIIKESVKEALEEELIKLRLMFFPEVSDKKRCVKLSAAMESQKRNQRIQKQ